jgi:hypothetical protein
MHNPFRKPSSGLDPQHVLYQAAESSRIEHEQIARAFARLFSSDDGRLVLGHLQALTFQRALSSGALDTELRYAEGQRALVAQILRLIDKGRQG